MSATQSLELTDDHGDTLTVVDTGPYLQVRTPRGMVVHLDHDDTQALRAFLTDHLPAPADEAV